MNKSDLRTGMLVEDSEGAVGVVLKNTATVDGIKWFYSATKRLINIWEELDECFNEDLTGISISNDIVKVYQPHNFDHYTTLKAYDEDYLIWERGIIKEVTILDIEKQLGYKVKIIG